MHLFLIYRIKSGTDILLGASSHQLILQKSKPYLRKFGPAVRIAFMEFNYPVGLSIPLQVQAVFQTLLCTAFVQFFSCKTEHMFYNVL